MLRPKRKKQVKVVKVKPIKKTAIDIMGGSNTEPPKMQDSSKIKVKAKPIKQNKTTTPKVASIPKADTSIHIAPSITGSYAIHKESTKRQPKQQVTKEEKKRIVLERMIADREAAGITIPTGLKQRAMSDNMTELQAVSKELQRSKYSISKKKAKDTKKTKATDTATQTVTDQSASKPKKKGMTKRQEDIWKKTNDRIRIIESYGYKIPQSIKDEVRPVNADYSRVKDVFKMLGGNLKTGTIDDNKNLYVKIGKENEFLRNVGLQELDIESLPKTEKELAKISRKSSPEYMKVIKGDTDIHTRIESVTELETVVNDILSEKTNINIAKKNVARVSELKPENIKQLEIDKKLKKAKLDFGMDVDTKSVADDLVATFLTRFGTGKRDVQIKDIYRRLLTGESVGYQLSTEGLRIKLNKLVFNKENKSDTRSLNKWVKDNVNNDVTALQKDLEETGDLSESEIQDRLKEYAEQRKAYYEDKIAQAKSEMIDYVRGKMIRALSDIQSKEGRIDPHTSLQVELNKLIGGFVETSDENINNAMDKIKSRYDFTDDQLYYIEQGMREKIGNKNFMTRADLETLATQAAYERGYYSGSLKKVEKLMIDRFTDQERLLQWRDSQIAKYNAIQGLRVHNFITVTEDRLAGHPSWEQCKDLFYATLYDALLNAFNLGFTPDEVMTILAKRSPEYKDELYKPEYGEKWMLSLFYDLKYTGDFSSVISVLKMETGWESDDFAIAYRTGVIKENPATTKEKKTSIYKKNWKLGVS